MVVGWLWPVRTRPMPTKEQWEAEALHQYGLIAVDSKGDAMQLEKVDSTPHDGEGVWGCDGVTGKKGEYFFVE